MHELRSCLTSLLLIGSGSACVFPATCQAETSYLYPAFKEPFDFQKNLFTVKKRVPSNASLKVIPVRKPTNMSEAKILSDEQV